MLSNSSHDASGYDPMKMLKQNTKKTFIEDESQDILKSSDKTTESNADNTDKKTRAYHSSDDSDDQIAVSPQKTKKATKHSDVNEKSDSKAESTEQESESTDRSTRQTILLSATLTPAVKKLAGLAMRDPVFVDAAKENLQAAAGDASEINEDLIVPQGVTQSYIVTPPKLRMVTLSAYIAGECRVRKTLRSSKTRSKLLFVVALTVIFFFSPLGNTKH